MEITVKTYNTPKEFEKDQPRMMQQGWTVQSTASHQPRRSVAGLLFVPFAIFRPPQPKIMVTYQRSVSQPQQQPGTRIPTFREAYEEAKQKRKDKYGF